MRNDPHSLGILRCRRGIHISPFPAILFRFEGAIGARRFAAFIGMMMISSSLALLPDGVARAETPPSALHQPSTPASDPYAEFVAEASQRFNIPAAWIRAVMRVESAGDRHAISRKGAMGLMQIMPPTWAELRARHHLGGNPYDPRDNILAGAAYLRELHDRYGSPGFLAAYNAGPGRYEEYLTKGRALPAETRDYVAKLAPFVGGGDVMGPATNTAARSPSWNWARLFVARSDFAPSADRLPSQPQTERRLGRLGITDLSAIAPQSNDLFVRRPSIGRSQ